MKTIEFIRTKIQELFDRYEREDFNLVKEIMSEAGYDDYELKAKGVSKNFSSYLFSFLCEELYRLGLKKNKIVNILYLIKHIPKKEYVYIGERGQGETENEKEVFPGVIIHKDIFYNVLDKLNLTLTKEAYCNYLIINENEINSNLYFSTEQIEKFKSFQKINEILEKEYSTKLDSKQKFVVVD